MVKTIAPAVIFAAGSVLLLVSSSLSLIPVLGFGLVLLAAGLLFWTSAKKGAVLALGLAGVALLLAYQIHVPWVDAWSGNGAVWSLHGRNIARHGFIETRGMLFTNGGPLLDKEVRIYNHHPPGLVWLLAVLFQLFGAHEAVARLVPAIFTFIGVAALVFWTLRRWGGPAAGGVLLAAASCPAVTYFGRMVNFEPLVLVISLLFYTVLDWAPGQSKRPLLFGMICLAVAPLIGWVGAIWALPAAWYLSRRKAMTLSLGVYAIPILVLVAVVLFISNGNTGGVGGSLHRSLKWTYTMRPDAAPGAFQWMKVIVGHIHKLVPAPLFLLMPCLLFRRFRQGLPAPLLVGTLVPFALLLPVMPHAFYIHHYHVMSLWVPAALVAAQGMRLTAGAWRRTALALFMLLPLAFGIRSYKTFHAPEPAAVVEKRVGELVNRSIPPLGRVAIIYGNQQFEPVLWFYLDRRFKTYRKLEKAAVALSTGDYCLLPPGPKQNNRTLPAPYSLKKIVQDPSGYALFQKVEAESP